MQVTIRIDGKDQLISVPDDATPEEIDEIVNTEATAPLEPQSVKQSTLASIGGMLSRGATLGFGDEISGAADAVLQKIRGNDAPIGDLYREKQQMYDRENDQFAADHPLIGGALEATGSALPTAAAIVTGNPALSPQVQAGSAAARVARAGALGANTGALAGYGSADPGERTEGAGIGALVGGALGTGAGGLVEGLSPMAQKLREPTRKILSYVEEMVSGPPKVARAAAPTAPATTSAQSKILQSIERDRTTPAAVADQLKAQQQLGKPAGIIDVAGENTRGLGRATVTLPGPGRQTAAEALNARADDQMPRVLQDAERGVGVAAQDTDELSRQIIERRGEAARPAYEKAYAQGELTQPDLIAMMDQNPAYAQAHNKARKLLAGANKEIPELFNAENGQLVRWPTVADVDLIKKGLDSRLYNNKRGVTDQDEPALDKYFAGVLEGQRTRLLSAVDDVAPDYKTARAGFAGDTAMNEALEAGQDLFNTDPRQVTRLLSEMDEGRQEMFRTGALDAIRKRLLSAADNAERANVVKSIFGYGKGGRRDLVATLFKSPDELAHFQAQMESEIQMHQTRQHVMGGSQTANKLADAEDSGLPLADAAVDFAGGNFKSGAMRLGRDAVNSVTGRWKAGITEGTRSEVADELFNFTEAERAQEFLRQLEQIRLSREATMRTKKQLGTVASVTLGAQAQ